MSNTPPPRSIQFTISEVEEALLDLYADKVHRPDRIPPSILKKVPFRFSSSLLDTQQVICNLRFSRKMETLFRYANISNYRGIALLSAVAKLFELLICRSLYDDHSDFLSKHQHRFYNGTVSNLIEYSWFILKTMENGYQVDSLYTDFSKAFDKIRHCLLLLKFILLLIDPAHCELLRSYISRWIQHIRIGNCISSEIKVTSGVPLYILCTTVTYACCETKFL
jgi:Reverse transcriptase (RNA-dependent DNA polymerase)